MKSNPSSKNPGAAFNLTELCVVMACVAVLSMLVLPALAATKMQSASAGCLYNLRHLMTGWEMYRTENNDYLMPNAPLGYTANKLWCSGFEGWSSLDANTNPVYYTSSLMWPYVNNNLSVYHCPGDVVPSANGTRIRSYSMNSQVGAVYTAAAAQSVSPGYLTYSKGSDLIRPIPANLFVFADESMLTLNDYYLQVWATPPVTIESFYDIPACYLEGGCGFSFADGHGEIHRWQTKYLLNPVVYGQPTFPSLVVGNNNADWLWFTQHATSHQ